MPLRHSKVQFADQVCSFFEQYLNYTTRPDNFEAFRVIGKRKDSVSPPIIIVKIVGRGEKTKFMEETRG